MTHLLEQRPTQLARKDSKSFVRKKKQTLFRWCEMKPNKKSFSNQSSRVINFHSIDCA
jgi:hypothetical protein